MHRRLLRWENTCSLAEVCDLPALDQAADLLGLVVEDTHGPNDSSPHVSLATSGPVYLLTIGVRQFTFRQAEGPAHYLAVAIPWTFHKLSPDPVLHASSCVVDNEAVLFCGRSETGKSSLIAAAWELGLPVINDDCTVVDPAGATVRPFPQGFSLRLSEPVLPEPFARFLDQGSQYFLGRGLKSDNWVLFGRSTLGLVPYGVSLPVRALYLIRRGSSTRCIPADRQKALSNILAQTYPGRAGNLAILPFIENLMREGKIHELEVGDGDFFGAVSLAVSPKK